MQFIWKLSSSVFDSNLFSIQVKGSFCEAIAMEDPIMMEAVFEKGPLLCISVVLGIVYRISFGTF